MSFWMCFEKSPEIKRLRTAQEKGEFNISRVLQHMIDENRRKNKHLLKSPGGLSA